MQAILTMDGNTDNGFDKQNHSVHANDFIGVLMAALVTTVIIMLPTTLMKPLP